MATQEEIKQEEILVKMKEIIEIQKEIAFIEPEKAKDTEALGTLISKLSEWDGNKIIEILLYALEDANNATRVEQISKLTGVNLR